MPEQSVALPTIDEQPYQTGDARVWVKPERDDLFGFLGCFGAGGFTWTQPDVTPVLCPDPSRPRKFVQVDSIEGAPSPPETSIMGRTTAIQFLFELVRRGCPLHIDVRMTRCDRPDDPDGWELIRRFCNGRITDYSSDDQVVQNESGEVMETAAIAAETMYVLRRIQADEVDGVLGTDITAVWICDELNCGDCNRMPSDGCQRWFVGTADFGGTPYVGLSTDGGETWTFYPVTPWAANEDISDGICVGDRIVVVTAQRGALAYSDDNGATWTEVTTGFLPGGDGRAICAVDARHIWIAGEAGAIYFTDNPTTRVTVQEDGLLTNQHLNAIKFVNSQDGYAVGDNNTFLYTENGGDTWLLGTGPSAGVDLTALEVHHENYMRMVIVGTSNGEVWQTFDGGATWTERDLPGTATYNIPAIAKCGCAGLEFFLAREVGTYLAPSDGELFRSIDGGLSWQEIDLPTNDGVEDVACCSPNYAIVVGHLQTVYFGAQAVGFIAVVS